MFKPSSIWYIVIAVWDHQGNKWNQEVVMVLQQIPKNVNAGLAQVMGTCWKSAIWVTLSTLRYEFRWGKDHSTIKWEGYVRDQAQASSENASKSHEPMNQIHSAYLYLLPLLSPLPPMASWGVLYAQLTYRRNIWDSVLYDMLDLHTTTTQHPQSLGNPGG